MPSATSCAACLLIMTSLARAGQFQTRTLKTTQGLPSNSVNGIFQDSRGFIWIATLAGIGRFDGREVKVWAPSGGDTGDYARYLLEDRNGDIWAAGMRGLVRFSGPDMGRAVTVQGPSDAAGRTALCTILPDPDGGFWAGGHAGLFRFFLTENGGTSPFQPASDAAPVMGKTVFALLRDRRNALWIGTNDALYRRGVDGSLLLVATARAVAWLIEDRAGNIYATTFDKGILRVDAAATAADRPLVHSCTEAQGLPSNYVFSVTETADGRLLAGAHGGVAERIVSASTEALCAFRRPEDLDIPVTDIRALYQDRDGGIWAGTEKGVLQISTAGFASYSCADGLVDSAVQSIFESRGDLFAVSGHIGVSRFDGRRFQPVIPNVTGAKQFPQHGWATRQTILRDRAGDWWVPTEIGLYRFANVADFRDLNTARPRIYRRRDGLPTDAVFRLFEDSRGTLWISTIYGSDILTSMDRRRLTFVRRKVVGDSYTLPHGPPTAFFEDSSGALWVGFWHGALARLRDGQWSYFRPADGAPGGFVHDIQSGRDGRLWVGSAAGLTCIVSPEAPKPELVSYTKSHGLASTAITCLTQDAAGRLYLGTYAGIDRIDPKNFPGPIRHYSSWDGLPPATPMSACRDRAGRLWFGSPAGLASLLPQPDKGEAANPVVLTSVRIRGAEQIPLSWKGLQGIRLPASQNDLEFHFVMPSPRGLPVSYRYRLVGADEDWSGPTENGTLHYVGLPPGHYELMVEGFSADGGKSSHNLATFEIMTPIWRRWWTLTLAAALLGGLAYAAHRYRLRRVMELERVRMRIATDLHDELGADLSRLAVLSEAAQLAGGREDALRRIAGLSRQMLDATADVVWAIRPQKDRLSDLVNRMREFADDLLASKNMRVSFRTPSRDVRLDPNLRRQIFSIFKECVNNAARHSGAGAVDIEIGISKDHLTLRISDDGRGFRVPDACGVHSRHGVSGMRWRAAVLGGRLDLESRPGEGATMRLQVPLRK